MAPSALTSRLWFAAAAMVMAAALGMIVWYQAQYSLIADNAIMLEFARRIAEGGHIITDYVDTNFPQSILIYLPVPLLETVTGIPSWYLFPAYSYGLAIVSTFMTFRLLCLMPFLPRRDALLLAILYLVSFCYATDIHLGQRDPVIFLGLFPMVLAQFCLNEGYALPRRLLYTALTFGTVMVLVKPHYGLMPVIMLLWYVMNRRGIMPLFRRTDFLVLCAGTTLMILINAVFFHDFYTAMLADIMHIYAGLKGDTVTLRFLLPTAFFLAAIPVSILMLQNERRRFSLMLSLLGLSLLIAYYVQQKGLYYHLIPAFSLAAFHCAALFGLTGKKGDVLPAAAIGVTLLLAIIFPVNPQFPRHADIAALPAGQILAEHCPAPCRFYMTGQNNFIAYETALYTGSLLSSRFPSLWFDPYIACAYAKEEPDPAAEALIEKYGAMLAEDLNRYQPSVLIISTSEYRCERGATPAPAYPEIYKNLPAFAAAWQPYEKLETLEINRRDYFRGTDADYDYTLYYDVYRRAE